MKILVYPFQTELNPHDRIFENDEESEANEFEQLLTESAHALRQVKINYYVNLVILVIRFLQRILHITYYQKFYLPLQADSEFVKKLVLVSDAVGHIMLEQSLMPAGIVPSHARQFRYPLYLFCIRYFKQF